MTEKYQIGIDLGGTNIAAGIVDENFRIVGKASVPTEVNGKNGVASPEEIADRMAQAVRLAAEKAAVSMDEVGSVGIGTPGSADPFQGIVKYANNLHFFQTPLSRMMEDRLHKPVYLANDANAAAYGEAMAGASKGCANSIMITLGTGVGGGVIIDGKIVTGCSFCGGELGHMGMMYGGEPCTCGRKGCFEAYCSATALIRQTRRKMEQFPDSAMWGLCGGSLDKVDGRTAFDGMRAGDKAAAEVVEQYISYLGYALTNYVNLLQPEMLLIGGGISKEGETILAPLREIVNREAYCKDPEENTKIAAATLGNDAGIIGAASLYRLYQK